MEKLKDIIKKRAKKEFNETDNLIAQGIIDSIDFINIIGEIEEEYGVEINFLEIDPQKITTLKGLWEVINEVE